MLRIAYVSTDPGVPVFGSKGASVHVQGVVKAMASAGTVRIFSSGTTGERPADLREVETQPVNWPRGTDRDLEGAVEGANASLRSMLGSAGPFDLVYERYALWSYAGMEYAKASGTPGVLEVNAPLIEEEARYRGLTHRALAVDVAGRVFGASSLIIAVSSGVAKYLAGFQGTEKKVRVLHNAIDPDRFPSTIAPSRPARNGVFTVGFLGSLKPWHGLGTLAEAFALLHRKVPNSRLLIVGDGPERERFSELLTERGMSGACEFVGAVPPPAVPPLVASMDVGVAPYPDLEGFYFSPLKVLEYMAAGKPVVASKVGDLPELVRDGIGGLLVPPDDPRALESALHRLFVEPGLRESMGSAARMEVLRSHTWESVVRNIFELCGLAPYPKAVGV